MGMLGHAASLLGHSVYLTHILGSKTQAEKITVNFLLFYRQTFIVLLLFSVWGQ